MAFSKKTWVDRIAEYPTRRRLKKSDGSDEIVTVSREEGTISQEGDAFNAENMNDLETRISEEFTSLNESLVTTNTNVATAQATANAAIDFAIGSLTFSSTTYFTPYGTAFVNKTGKMCAIHTVFQCKDLAAGAVIAGIPEGYRPKNNYLNIGIPRIDVSSAAVVTVKITTAGQIVTHNSVPAGLYMLDFSYTTS